MGTILELLQTAGVRLLISIAFVAVILFLQRLFARPRLLPSLIALVSGAYVAILLFVVLDHVTFPLHLEAMEGVLVQHLERARNLEPIYPAPDASFVALAYNPLHYYLAIPFTWIFESDLVALRVLSILGLFGSMGLVFAIVRRETRSGWWGWASAGLFASAYAVMDVYLDTAHVDSQALFCILLATWALLGSGRRRRDWLAVLALVLAFWLKQHGAVLAVFGILYLLGRDGIRRTLPLLGVAVVLGPVLYLIASPLFGSHFHFFTWEVPGQWTEVTKASFVRYGKVMLGGYSVLGLLACVDLWLRLREGGLRAFTVVQVMVIAGLVSGAMGALDPESGNNVFATAGAFLIVGGCVAAHRLAARFEVVSKRGIDLAAVAASFGLLLYAPAPLLVSDRAGEAFEDLAQELSRLDGEVYLPWIGKFPEGSNGFNLPNPEYTAHWVPLLDLDRGPGRVWREATRTREILSELMEPPRTTYILSNWPLFECLGGFFSFLEERYVLVEDYGERFQPLQSPPRRFNVAWPRYLYRSR